MTSKQYEELCRRFLGELFHLKLDQIRSREAVNPWRPDMPHYAHQIDLYWEVETEAVRYLHIADAKWREMPNYLDQCEVLLLHQVKTQVGAHKAMLLTNLGFAPGAVAAAADLGVALYIVRPTFARRQLDARELHLSRRKHQSHASVSPTQPPYEQLLILKSFPPDQEPAAAAESTAAELAPPGFVAIQVPSGDISLSPEWGGRD
jgi:hypothetical protein